MDYISVKDTVRLWNVSERWVHVLCGEGRIVGVQRFGRLSMIPKDAGKPDDLYCLTVKFSEQPDYITPAIYVQPMQYGKFWRYAV